MSTIIKYKPQHDKRATSLVKICRPSMCGQLRPKLYCADAQSDQGIHCPLPGYYRMYQWRAKAQIRPCVCAGWRESGHFAHAQRHFFTWCGHWLIVLGFNNTSTILGLLCHLPEKRRKEIEEIVEEMKEEQGSESNRNENEETEVTKTFTFYLYLLQG